MPPFIFKVENSYLEKLLNFEIAPFNLFFLKAFCEKLVFIACSKTAIEGFSNCEKVNGLNFSQTVAMRKQECENVNLLRQFSDILSIQGKWKLSSVGRCRRGSIEPLWGVDGSLMLVQCYHAMLTLGKSLPSHQRSFCLLWKKGIISDWQQFSFPAEALKLKEKS